MSKIQFNSPDDLRRSYLQFMQARGSVIVPTAGLVPENDPTTLFTGSGMQPMIPYLLGQTHPAGRDIANVQKCIRTVDIENIGDNSHLTFFEMIGRWAFGADPQTYKHHQITSIWAWQVGELQLDPRRLYVSVYRGSEEIGIARDDDAIAVWSELFQSVGIEPVLEAEPWIYGASRGGRIFLYDEAENWWSRAGHPDNMPVGEPGGPDSEMFFDFDPGGEPLDHPATDTARFTEIGNNVFMAAQKTNDGFLLLDRPNIDYGGGLERIASAVNGNADVYLTPFFTTAIAQMEVLSGLSYVEHKCAFRIVLDHIRASTFLIGDGVLPSNSDVGYITRRLLRRAIRVGKKLSLPSGSVARISEIFISEAKAYPELTAMKNEILTAVSAEERQFQKTVQAGEREIKRHLDQHGQVTGSDAFRFYETYGFPVELTEELLKENRTAIIDRPSFDAAADMHAARSRTASAGKFKGGLADQGEKTTALHTATHLMLAGLRQVLGEHVHQKGSNITAERARFDFSHDGKMTDTQRLAVEAYVNAAIATDAEMTVVEMDKQKAKDEGVVGSFWEKYPDVVKVYEMKDSSGIIWSRELCGGPHVGRTSDMHNFGVFSIQKEESVSAGVRRVKVILA